MSSLEAGAETEFVESVPAGPVLAKGGERKEGEWTERGVRLRCRLIGALANPVCRSGQAPQSCSAPALGNGLRGRG